MRRLLLATIAASALAAGSAFAADLPARVDAPAPAPIFVGVNWTGFYIGAQVGYNGAQTDHSFDNGAPNGTSKPDGFIGGLHAGYNHQMGQLVLGIEADINYLGGRGTYTNLAGITSVGSSKYDWAGTVRARLGFAVDRALFYVTGGVAFADLRYGGGPAPLPVSGSFSDTRAGWTAGAGVEYAFTNNWSMRAEYRYTDFGRSSGALVPAFPGVTMRASTTSHAGLVGLTYRFSTGGGAVVAKY